MNPLGTKTLQMFSPVMKPALSERRHTDLFCCYVS